MFSTDAGRVSGHTCTTDDHYIRSSARINLSIAPLKRRASYRLRKKKCKEKRQLEENERKRERWQF